jgi:hypothetical protein
MRSWLMAGAIMALISGCGSAKYAPVSGRITLNGNPLPSAFVTFNPIPKSGSIEAGPTAVGTTDQDGRYTLRVSSNQSGALIGNHRVAITVVNAQGGDAPLSRSARPAPVSIPAHELTFEVKPGGTDEANFDLRSP